MTLRFLIDAQLPPRLAEALRSRGFEAEHVADIGLGASPDSALVAHALERGMVIVSKDADFADRTLVEPALRVVWVRIGNTTTRNLLRMLEPRMDEIVAAILDGERLIEIR